MTGNGGGYLPTPTAKGNAFAPSMAKWPAYHALQKSYGQEEIVSLFEFLMGWPAGWSAVEPLATDRFRQWLHSHGVRSEAHDGS